MFLNHSQSIIQPVHPAVNLLPQPLSSSPAIWEPPLMLFLPLPLPVPQCAKGKRLHWNLQQEIFQMTPAVCCGGGWVLLSSNCLSETVGLLVALIFPFASFVGCWSHYNSYLTRTTYKAFGSPPSSSPKGLLSNGTSMPTMEVGFLCLRRHCTSL